MPRRQDKNTDLSVQDSVSPPECSNPIYNGSWKCNIDESQDNTFRVAFMKMLVVLREDSNTSINKFY